MIAPLLVLCRSCMFMAKCVSKPLLEEALSALQRHVHLNHVGAVPVDLAFMKQGYADSKLSPVVLPTSEGAISLIKPSGNNSMYLPASPGAAVFPAENQMFQSGAVAVTRSRHGNKVLVPVRVTCTEPMQTLLLTRAKVVDTSPRSISAAGLPASIGCAMESSGHKVQFPGTHPFTEMGGGQQVAYWRWVGVQDE